LKLSVKRRIQFVMAVIVAVNVVAGVVSWDLYRSAAQSGARARAAAERARLATTASEGVTEFMGASTDLALGVNRGTSSQEQSLAYGTLIGVDPVVNHAIERVAAATPGRPRRGRGSRCASRCTPGSTPRPRAAESFCASPGTRTASSAKASQAISRCRWSSPVCRRWIFAAQFVTAQIASSTRRSGTSSRAPTPMRPRPRPPKRARN
jgi:hypothetical protein